MQLRHALKYPFLNRHENHRRNHDQYRSGHEPPQPAVAATLIGIGSDRKQIGSTHTALTLSLNLISLAPHATNLK
jgi:hypothetical protein